METMAQSPADTGAVSHAGVPAVTLATPVCRFEDFLGATAADRLLDDACRAQLEHLAAERGQDAQIPSTIGLGVGFIVGPGSGVGSSIPPPGDPCRMKYRIGRNFWLLVTTVLGPLFAMTVSPPQHGRFPPWDFWCAPPDAHAFSEPCPQYEAAGLPAAACACAANPPAIPTATVVAVISTASRPRMVLSITTTSSIELQCVTGRMVLVTVCDDSRRHTERPQDHPIAERTHSP